MISKSQEETEVSWRLEEKAGGPVKKLDLDIVHRESPEERHDCPGHPPSIDSISRGCPILTSRLLRR
jgi:hypothetical protein